MKFEVTGYDATGQLVRGVVEAPNHLSARERAAGQGVLVEQLTLLQGAAADARRSTEFGSATGPPAPPVPVLPLPPPLPVQPVGLVDYALPQTGWEADRRSVDRAMTARLARTIGGGLLALGIFLGVSMCAGAMSYNIAFGLAELIPLGLCCLPGLVLLAVYGAVRAGSNGAVIAVTITSITLAVGLGVMALGAIVIVVMEPDDTGQLISAIGAVLIAAVLLVGTAKLTYHAVRTLSVRGADGRDSGAIVDVRQYLTPAGVAPVLGPVLMVLGAMAAGVDLLIIVLVGLVWTARVARPSPPAAPSPPMTNAMPAVPVTVTAVHAGSGSGPLDVYAIDGLDALARSTTIAAVARQAHLSRRRLHDLDVVLREYGGRLTGQRAMAFAGNVASTPPGEARRPNASPYGDMVDSPDPILFPHGRVQWYDRTVACTVYESGPLGAGSLDATVTEASFVSVTRTATEQSHWSCDAAQGVLTQLEMQLGRPMTDPQATALAARIMTPGAGVPTLGPATVDNDGLVKVTLNGSPTWVDATGTLLPVPVAPLGAATPPAPPSRSPGAVGWAALGVGAVGLVGIAMGVAAIVLGAAMRDGRRPAARWVRGYAWARVAFAVIALAVWAAALTAAGGWPRVGEALRSTSGVMVALALLVAIGVGTVWLPMALLHVARARATTPGDVLR